MSTSTPLDEDSVRWLADLRDPGAARGHALTRLHAMLLGVARAEAFRRRSSLPADVVADLDDLCMQAAHDAMAAVLAKLDTFRGASRFTTWVYKFALFEISVRLRRRAWSTRRVDLDDLSWGRVADPAPAAERTVEQAQLLEAVRKLVETTLTEKQRSVLLAVAAEEVPIDVIAERTGSSRGAVYKLLHDARRKLRESLALAGHLEAE